MQDVPMIVHLKVDHVKENANVKMFMNQFAELMVKLIPIFVLQDVKELKLIYLYKEHVNAIAQTLSDLFVVMIKLLIKIIVSPAAEELEFST